MLQGEERLLDVREYLVRVDRNQMSLEELFHLLVKNLSDWTIVYQTVGSERNPLLSKGNQNSDYIAAFTDPESAGVIRVDQPQHLQVVSEPALTFLLKAYRSQADGVILNPGQDSPLFLIKPHVQKLIYAYAVEQFKEMPGPWVPTLDDQLLLVEYQKGQYSVAVYVSEQDAQYATQRSGGQAVQHSWEKIEERCRELGAAAPYFHFGLPEQGLLSPEHAAVIFSGRRQKLPEQAQTAELPEQVPAANQLPEPLPQSPEPVSNPSRETATSNQEPERVQPQPVSPEPVPRKPVDPDVAMGLKKLERATIEGQGMGNGWEVCRAMAELRRIWVVVDPDGNMVILAGQDQSPIVDFFTSAEHAERLIQEAREKNPNLPPMVPRLISTKKLYRALAPRQPIVWINRGSPEAWTSIMGDTLPYVLQLMSQLQDGKK